jgi:hypothetical protein
MVLSSVDILSVILRVNFVLLLNLHVEFDEVNKKRFQTQLHILLTISAIWLRLLSKLRCSQHAFTVHLTNNQILNVIG